MTAAMCPRARCACASSSTLRASTVHPGSTSPLRNSLSLKNACRRCEHRDHQRRARRKSYWLLASRGATGLMRVLLQTSGSCLDATF
eukprot:6188888-Pleurochrysis_carterae.AAC.2